MGLSAMLPGMTSTVVDDKVHKSLTELFVGNLPPDADGPLLKEFLNAAMAETKLTSGEGDAITDLRHTPGSKFAFLVVRTVEECTHALCLTGIPYNASMLKIERPGSFVGVKTGAMTWQQLTGSGGPPTEVFNAPALGSATVNALALATLGGGIAVDPTTKPFRELFIGNVVEGTPGSDIHEFLGAVMSEVGLADSSMEGNPIMHVRTNGKFAFVELRSVDETNNALNLDGIPFQGMELRVKRPEKYVGNPTPSVTWREFLELRGEVESSEPQGSCVVMVGNAIRTNEADASEESYRAVCDHLREEIGKHGVIVDMVVPRLKDSAAFAFDYSEGSLPKEAHGVGKCFVRFKSHGAAEEAIQELAKKNFDGQDLTAELFEEEPFLARNFSGV